MLHAESIATEYKLPPYPEELLIHLLYFHRKGNSYITKILYDLIFSEVKSPMLAQAAKGKGLEA